MVLILAACATTSVEPQSRSRDARQARLNFLRQPGLFGSYAVAYNIAINGQHVGAVAPSSYFFVDRPPGRYTMVVQGTLDPGFETDVEVAAGASYYFEVAPRPPRTTAEVIDLATMRIPGEPMPGRGII